MKKFLYFSFDLTVPSQIHKYIWMMKKRYQFFSGGCDSSWILKRFTLNSFSRLGQEREFGKCYKKPFFPKLWDCGAVRLLFLISKVTIGHFDSYCCSLVKYVFLSFKIHPFFGQFPEKLSLELLLPPCCPQWGTSPGGTPGTWAYHFFLITCD